MSILLGQGLEGKLVIVTGAASGIGFQTALMLDKVGAVVAALDVNEKGLQELSNETFIVKFGVDTERILYVRKTILGKRRRYSRERAL